MMTTNGIEMKKDKDGMKKRKKTYKRIASHLRVIIISIDTGYLHMQTRIENIFKDCLPTEPIRWYLLVCEVQKTWCVLNGGGKNKKRNNIQSTRNGRYDRL